MDYRNLARNALERAKNELSHDDTHRLRYAALELRMSLEAIIYERGGNYRAELPSQGLAVWQPRKLLNMLLELDPYADKSPTLSFGLEEEYGKPAKEMKLLGTDRVLSLSEIKKYYDKLGSYLHTQTIEQVAQNKGPKHEGMVKRCNEVIRILEEVLSSPVFNTDLKVTSTIACANCGVNIVRRKPPQNETLIVKCIECPATYDMFSKDDETIEWVSRTQKVKCANQLCENKYNLYEKEVHVGTSWVCLDCSCKNEIVLSLQCEPKEDENSKAG